jgi:hypothetical protein
LVRCWLCLNRYESFLGLGAGKFSELSSEDKDFVSLEVGEVLSSLLLSEGLAEVAGSELLGDALLGDDGSEFAGSSSSADLDDLAGELKSADGDDLSLDAFSVNQHSLVVDDVDNGSELAFERTVVNSSDTSDFDEFVVALNYTVLTMLRMW